MRDFAIKLNKLQVLIDEYCIKNNLYCENMWVGGKHYDIVIALHSNDDKLKLHTVLSLPTNEAESVEEAWELKSVYPQ